MLTPEELDRVHVVLARVRNPLNMGAVARAMSNFGLLQMRVVKPYEVAFRDARSAVGAVDVLRNARECASVAEAVGDCTLVVGSTAVGSRELLNPLHVLDAGMELVRQRLGKGETVALVFGSEQSGLSKEEISHCDILVRIPTRDAHRSMNLGQAAAVCFYELLRGAGRPLIAEENRLSTSEEAGAEDAGAGKATGIEVERMEKMLGRVLAVSGYTEPEARVSTEQRVRRLLRRMRMGSGDVEEWLGMLRKIAWKLDREANRES